MKKSLLLTFLFAMFISLGFSQSDKFWSVNNESRTNITTAKAVARLSFPKEFKLFNLNIDPLRQELLSIVDQSSKHSTIISLPNADGQLEQFEVFEASNFEPALQAQFPQIRAYSGKGITDKYATLKLSISPQGIQTMVFRTDKSNEFIEPYSQNHTIYAVFKSERKKGELPWTCSVDDKAVASDLSSKIANTNKPTSSAGELKTMRLAQSVTAEYSNYFGAFSAADVALVLGGINTTMTRCNGVYEKDLALHLNIIANTTDVIYYNPSTDPYSPAGVGAGGAWNGELQATLTSVIGDPNYDIGHLFGASGGGGNAGCIGCVCGSGKGSGFTSPADAIPEGDNFDIDYVVHEVGHQLGANHTFSMNIEGSGANNKEVGSGITIMGYAGITAQDVAPHSIDIFHEHSIQQIQNNLATKTCPITTNITATNATPVVAPVSNYTIPISTPFALTGSATDANPGDVLTYCWEQNDPANSTVVGVNSRANPTKLVGPNWLSFSPSTNPTRTCPVLATILAGNFTTGPLPGGDPGVLIEALSSVSRDLKFRLTVRDNAVYSSTVPLSVGQTAFTDMIVTVTTISGPFGVSQPNTALSWPALSTQTITWTVANTTATPVSCANVNILLSTDGGFTWPITLAANTANDGTETLTIPNNVTTTARVKVESVGNIFFDISNTNFSITPAVSGFTFNATTPTVVACPAPATPTVTLGTTANGSFSTPINLTAIAGVPAGTTVSFSPNPVTPGNSTTVTLNNANTLPNGTYAITVQGVAGTVTQTAVVTFTVSAGTGPVITGQPANVTVCAGAPASFTVTATGVTTYQWQVNTGTGFNNIVGANAASFNIAATTGAQNGFIYQCVLTGQCGTTTSASATLTVNTPPAITTQPASTVVCVGTNATFTVTATGAGLGYQWELSVDGCNGPWFTIPGANTNTYVEPGITLANDNSGYRCIVTGSCAPTSVTSNCALLTVGNAAAITVQPVDVTVCEGQNAVFSVTGTGSISSYQWQEDAGAGFANIAGATSATLTLNAVTVAMSGHQYRVNVFSCTAIPIVSAAATLTVNSLATIGTQPISTSGCIGDNVSFTAAASGTGTGYQWQYAATCAGTFANIAGATSATLNLNSITLANAGAYRVVVAGTCNTATSSCVTLTVNSPITISAQPVDMDVCLPTTTASFSVTAAGTNITYQWQVNTGTGFADIGGETNATLNLTGLTAAMSGYQYRVVLNGTCTADLNSAAATLQVNSPAVVTVQPSDVATCTASAAVFTATATGSTIGYQWQMSSNGGISFVNVPSTAPFTGGTTNTLTISPVNTTYNGYVFHLNVSGAPCASDVSEDVTLTVNTLPVVVLTAASYSNINPYLRETLYATVSPSLPAGQGYKYEWYRDGVLQTNITGDRFDVTVDDLGSYEVVVTDTATGCISNNSNAARVDAAPSSTLFIFPNPSSGQFEVRFYNASSTTSRTLNIYDSKGARVYTKAYPITSPYTQMYVDMTNVAGGVYLVELRDAAGKRMAVGKVVIKQ